MGFENHLAARLTGVLALGLAMALLASPAGAATTAGTSRAIVVTPLSLVWDNARPLSFGNIVPSTTATGTVTINPFTEARTFTGPLILAGGTIGAAKFYGLADNTAHLKIDVPPGAITITRSGGGATMQIVNFTLNGDKNDWVNATEYFEFQVGGTLNVGINQPTGVYTGQFNVTVNYR